MIETGRVIGVEADSVWVETEQQAQCGGCSAQKVCGQSLLASLYPKRRNQLRVALRDQPDSPPALGDRVEFSVPDNALLAASLRVYLLPLVGMLMAAILGARLAWPEPVLVLAAVFGLSVGCLVSRWFELRGQLSDHLPKLEKVIHFQ